MGLILPKACGSNHLSRCARLQPRLEGVAGFPTQRPCAGVSGIQPEACANLSDVITDGWIMSPRAKRENSLFGEYHDETIIACVAVAGPE